VLQYVLPHQEAMTHIDVGDENSTPEQNTVRPDEVELSQAFEICGFRRRRCGAKPLVSGLRSGPFLHRLQLPRSSFDLVADFFTS
jgi:hypothetical protein